MIRDRWQHHHGGEFGISTDKVGARGSMGLDELTSYKWLSIDTGQIRS